MSDDNVIQFIPADKFDEKKNREIERVYPDAEEYSDEAVRGKELTQIAQSGNGVSRIRVPREISRTHMRDIFNDVFELVGGVPRMAHWADKNYGEFMKLYARLLPTAVAGQMEHTGEIVIRHVLPKGALDE
jgi:hypothetical protein